MSYEEKLLKINNIFSPPHEEMNFGDYLTLQNCLDEIGKITNKYFNMYEKTRREKNEKWEKWLSNALNTEVCINEDIILSVKYLLENYPCCK